MTTFAELLQGQLDPFLADDAANGNALTVFLTALAQMYEEVQTWADDDNAGNVGWSILLDLNRCPTYALPWLGQFVGAQVDTSLSDADQRTQISNVQAWKRGSVAAFVNAAQMYLTGTKTVLLKERDPVASAAQPAYGLTIYTYTSETPNSSKVLAALNAVKPAGIILNYQTITGWNYEAADVGYATYDAMDAAFATYNGLLTDAPGT